MSTPKVTSSPPSQSPAAPLPLLNQFFLLHSFSHFSMHVMTLSPAIIIVAVMSLTVRLLEEAKVNRLWLLRGLLGKRSWARVYGKAKSVLHVLCSSYTTGQMSSRPISREEL